MATLEDHVILYRLFRQAGSDPSPNDQPTDLYGRENSCVVYPTSQEVTGHPLFSDFREQRIYVLQYDAHVAIPLEVLYHSNNEPLGAHQRRLEQRLQRGEGIAEVLCFQLQSDRLTRWRAYPRGEGVGQVLACLTKYKHVTPSLYVAASACIAYHPLLSSPVGPEEQVSRGTKQRASRAGASAKVIQLSRGVRKPVGTIDVVLNCIFEEQQPRQPAVVLPFGKRNPVDTGSSDGQPFNRKPNPDSPSDPDDVA